MKKAITCFLMVSAIPASLSAYPSIRQSTPGSAIYFYVSNPEDRAYNCTLAFGWAYDSFGELKTGSESTSISVSPKQGDTEAYRFSGSYVNLRVTSRSFDCNPN